MLRVPVHSLLVLAVLSPAVTGAQRGVSPPQDSTRPPALVVGSFRDDYGALHTISATQWQHGARARYHVTKWNAAGQYLIAINDDNNPGDQGLFSRIDWVPLDMPPFTWAFCLSAFKAPSADSAERTLVAKRQTPRTGCNGFPFSRMKPSQP